MDWRFPAFIVSLLTILFGITWATSESGMCSSTYVIGLLADKTKDGALNCFEFWLNRYQTLLGALVAIAAAWLAWAATRGQVLLMRQQTAISLIEVVNSRMRAVNEIDEAMDQIDRITNQMVYSLNNAIIAAGKIMVNSGDSKQRYDIYKKELRSSAANYVLQKDNLRKRIVFAGNAIDKALFPSDARREVLEYIDEADQFDKISSAIVGRFTVVIHGTIVVTDPEMDKIVKIRDRQPIRPDFRSHPARSSVREAAGELSELLDFVLNNAHSRKN